MATPTEITTRLAVGEPPSGTSTREGARTVGIGMQVIIAGIRHLRIRRRPSRLAAAATATTGAGVAFIVGNDGTPVWQSARLVVWVAIVVLLREILSQPRLLLRAAAALVVGLLAVPVGIDSVGRIWRRLACSR